jgi:hypothetical protein
MSCPYCKRDEGHYLGCRMLEKPGMYEDWKSAAWAVGGVLLMGAVLWAVAIIFGGGG